MKALFLLFALATPILAQAQYQPDPVLGATPSTDEEAVRAAIDALFDGMRASDASAVRAVFHTNATLQSVVPAGPETFQIQAGDVPGFISSIGDAPEGALDEQLGEVMVQIDAGLAHAWMDYTFYYQGQRSHCGVNSMQLVESADGTWQILNVVDTRRRDCD